MMTIAQDLSLGFQPFSDEFSDHIIEMILLKKAAKERESINKITQYLFDLLADNLEPLGMTQYIRMKCSICAVLIVQKVREMPGKLEAKNSRKHTLKTKMRDFEKGLDWIDKGNAIAGLPPVSNEKKEQQRADRYHYLKFEECYPNDGKKAYEKMLLTLIWRKIWLVLETDIAQYKIKHIDKLSEMAAAALPEYEFDLNPRFARATLKSKMREAFKQALEQEPKKQPPENSDGLKDTLQNSIK